MAETDNIVAFGPVNWVWSASCSTAGDDQMKPAARTTFRRAGRPSTATAAEREPVG